ncbi:MAG: 16S rRNA (adenine(1518)-N(6)/adenine(1519)-N(6))-dimethyltransferase RsmA [Gammaproteobacteria bacterium]|nr:16S rRNA (adenine(1518)-N(6)/adenine(1519)-N(6))-dimethyltransferase RsmA [Gammaproteobacteria bacterium]
MPLPKKRFGQHFLRDTQILERIAGVCAAVPGEVTVEIGPGQGALTEHLLARIAHLHAIEIDRDLTAPLSARFGDRLIVHQTDALKLDFCTLGACLRVVGNLPYNISTPLIFHLIDQRCIAAMVFLLQKEVVDRLAAEPGDPARGRLSVMVQARCAVTPLFTVAPGAFFPPPKVDSRLVRLEPRAPLKTRDPAHFGRIVSAAFAQRRKMLRQSLKTWCTREDWQALGIDGTRRAETLTLAEFAAIADRTAARTDPP